MVQSTLQLYGATLKDTAAALLRGPFVWLYLIVLPVLVTGLGMLLSPLGMIGGFALGFAVISFFGAYLYGVGQSIERRTALGVGIIRESMGHHLWDVMGIAFIHWMVSLAFQYGNLPSTVSMLVGIVGFILFNPWTEVIHTERVEGSMDILVRSFRFMTANGPEWIIPHLLLFAVMGGLTMAPGSVDGFLVMGGGFALHPFMVFRGVLYRKLASGSRRSRNWKAQF
jgi:hypothetical protein